VTRGHSMTGKASQPGEKVASLKGTAYLAAASLPRRSEPTSPQRAYLAAASFRLYKPTCNEFDFGRRGLLKMYSVPPLIEDVPTLSKS
jgi:hypothetical protein